MRSRLITNLILLAIVITLVMVTLNELKPKEVAPTPISQLDTQTVSSIELVKTGKPLVHFSKQDGIWHITSPVKGLADPIKIKKLLAIAELNSGSHFPLDIEKSDRFGLKTPPITLKLSGLTIMVGNIAPISQQRYLGINKTLYLVTDNFYHHLIAQPKQYLKKPKLEAVNP
jgi:hypothetical protein